VLRALRQHVKTTRVREQATEEAEPWRP
jgi:hypothetical protein